jgi:hypothetical protein
MEKVIIMELKYKKHSRNGLKNNHVYVVKIFSPKNKLYVYTIQFMFDATDQEEMDLELTYASKISISQNFDYDELEIEE